MVDIFAEVSNPREDAFSTRWMHSVQEPPPWMASTTNGALGPRQALPMSQQHCWHNNSYGPGGTALPLAVTHCPWEVKWPWAGKGSSARACQWCSCVRSKQSYRKRNGMAKEHKGIWGGDWLVDPCSTIPEEPSQTPETKELQDPLHSCHRADERNLGDKEVGNGLLPRADSVLPSSYCYLPKYPFTIDTRPQHFRITKVRKIIQVRRVPTEKSENISFYNQLY